MREIKFRHWDVYDEKMYYQKDLVNTEIMGALYATELIKGKGNVIHMQYTGLKDKNGQEIYEGDIIYWDGSIIGVVKFEHAEFIVGEGNNARAMCALYSRHLEQIEVIGNIYENPELIDES